MRHEILEILEMRHDLSIPLIMRHELYGNASRPIHPTYYASHLLSMPYYASHLLSWKCVTTYPSHFKSRIMRHELGNALRPLHCRLSWNCVPNYWKSWNCVTSSPCTIYSRPNHPNRETARAKSGSGIRQRRGEGTVRHLFYALPFYRCRPVLLKVYVQVFAVSRWSFGGDAL